MKKNYRQYFCVFIFLFSFSLHVKAISDSLITTSASWKYLDNGSNQGTAWRATGFNDASWPTANAEFGYGDGDEVTIVNFGPNPNNKYLTTYFRKSFSVVNPAVYSSLTLGILRDDGAVVYLNGTEVYRTNMPTGNINSQTRAVNNLNVPEENTFQYFTFTAPFLVAGTNNISVEIHQFNKTSPDLSFNFNLAALQAPSCVTPVGLTTTNITSSSATLNWGAVAGAVGYNVQYRVVGNPTWTATSSAVNTILISGLLPSTNYQWQVQANCGSAVLSAFSSTATFTTTPFCGIPTGLFTTSITSASATLNWTAVSGAVGYNIEYRVVGNPVWTTATSPTNSLNISSLAPASSYEWHVQANCGTSNLSAFSSLSNFSTSPPPCNTPLGLDTTTITTTTALLNWTAVSGAVGYNIQYRVVGNPVWTTTTSPTSSVTITSLIPSTNYEWRVQADCGSSNLSAFSAIDNFTTLTPCGTPTGLNTTNIATTSATLNWTAVIGAVSYNIEYRVVGNPTWTTATSATNILNLSLLIPATNYEWRVQADCGSSNLSAFSSASNFTTATPLCATPAGLNTTNITTTSATLNWTAVIGAVSYNIEYRVVGNPTWATTTSATNSLNLSLLIPATNYEWRVQADCGSSNLSAFSSASNFTTATPLCATPAGLNTTNITTTSATLNWTAVIGAVSYNIEYRVVGNPTWTTTTSATNSLNLSLLIPAANYEWQVQADCGSSNLSAFSLTSNFTTATPLCATPAGLNTTNITTTSATLNWTAIIGAVSYNIEYRVVGNPTWTTATSATNILNLSLLIPATNYEWRVQADCGSSNLSAFSSASNFTTAALPCGTPTGLNTTNITTTTATLNWIAVSGAVNYYIEYHIVGNPTWHVTMTPTNSVTIAFLSPATAYEWRVATLCASSQSNLSSLSNFTTAAVSVCNTPISLTTTNITATSATLNWTVVAGAVSYNIEYRLIGNPTWSTTTSATNSVNISSLNPFSAYEWHVQANCGSSNLSVFSVITNFTTLALLCVTPTGLATTNITATSAQLNWNAVSGATSYNVQYRQVGSPFWTSSNTTATLFILSALTPAGNYEWQVQTVCAVNQSAYSSTVLFSTLSLTCTTPTGTITHSISETFAVLRWDAVVGATSYNVRYKPVASANWTLSNLTQYYFNYNGLSPGTDYEWHVQAVCPTGTSPFSALVSFRTAVNSGNDVFISSGDIWKYLDKGFDPFNWTSLTFNDSSWEDGPSELGYGDGDEAATVSYGPDPNFKYITTYFRKIFNVANPLDYYTMTLDVVRDDGIIVYVNGTEVYRNNMPAGPATYNTFASSAVSMSDESNWYTTTFSPSLLAAGNNIMAVEIHQVNQSSSDISFNLRLTGSDTVPMVTRGPYLQMMTQNSAMVRWRTNFATDSRVRYGLNPLDYDLMAYDPAITTEHSVTITGLQLSARYYYTVETGIYFMEGDLSYLFLTQAVNAPNSMVQIWALGDFGNNSAEQVAVRDAFRNDPDYTKTNLFFWLGDNAYEDGTDSEYQQNVFDIYDEELRRFPLFPAIGNHDYANVGYQSSSAMTTNFPYFDIVSVPTAAEAGGLPSGTEKYYSFNYYGIHFVVLDSYGALNTNASAMFEWLKDDLDENNQRWTIVYFHHPPYTMGSHNSDTEIEHINMRQNIIPLLESRHVDLVLSGHSHVNERSYLIKGHYGAASTFNSSMLIQGGSGHPLATPYFKSPPYDGTVYVVSGTGGKIATNVESGWPMPCMYFNDFSQNASLVINVDWFQLDCRFLSYTGINLDQFRIIKSVFRESGASGGYSNSLTVYPNPFTTEMNVAYTLLDDGLVELDLYSLTGEKIHSFTDGKLFQCAGIHEFRLSPASHGIAPGIYFARLIAGENVTVQKVAFVK